jgi:exosortase/archaeosortase family protein
MEDARDARRRRLRFAAVFTVVGGTLLTLYSFPYAAHGLREVWFAGYLTTYARLAGGVLHIFDRGVRVAGSEIVGRTTLIVAKNCDAMDVNILLAAAILAFPARWARRAAGIAVGVTLLLAANLGRIVSLYYVAVSWPRSFELIHAEIWPLGMVALAVAEFLIWSRWAVGGASADA